MRILSAIALVACFVSVSAACSGVDNPQNADFRFTAAYNMYSIDGHALPVPDVIAAGAYVTAGRLSPASSDTVLVERTVVGNGLSIVQRGSMVVHANPFVFRPRARERCA